MDEALSEFVFAAAPRRRRADAPSFFNLSATVRAFELDAGRLLCQKFVLSPICSTVLPDTTDCGATSVTSISSFA